MISLLSTWDTFEQINFCKTTVVTKHREWIRFHFPVSFSLCVWGWRETERGRKAGAEIKVRATNWWHNGTRWLGFPFEETEPSVWHRICFQEITPFLISQIMWGDKQSERDRRAFLPSSATARVFPRPPERTTVEPPVFLFALVYSSLVIKAMVLGKGKGRDLLYQVSVVIWGSHSLCWPVLLGLIKTELGATVD